MNNLSKSVQIKNSIGWHSRGFLPHFDGGQIPQSITIRLADSLPAAKLLAWSNELKALPPDRASIERNRRIESFLDRGMGSAWLAQEAIAATVQQALLFFDGERYRLHAWVIMPNHVHVLLTSNPKNTLSEILHTWKSYTSRKANALLRRSGAFWQNEYFDRFIRNQKHFEATVAYIENNPVKAGLCTEIRDWRFSSASGRILF